MQLNIVGDSNGHVISFWNTPTDTIIIIFLSVE